MDLIAKVFILTIQLLSAYPQSPEPPQSAPENDLYRDEYITLASLVTSPVFKNVEEAQSYSDTHIMLNNEVAYQALGSVNFSSSEMEKIRREIFSKLSACHDTMVELRELDATGMDFEKLATKALIASPSLVRGDEDGNLLDSDKEAVNELVASAVEEIISAGFDAYRASKARSRYRERYSAVLRTGLKLKKLAASGFASTQIEIPLLAVEINGSWGDFWDSNYIWLTNISDNDLTNVTLFIRLNGYEGDTGNKDNEQHIHFIESWPSGETRVIRYMSASASGFAADQAADYISDISYAIYSDQYRQEKSIAYMGEAYDQDVQRYFGKAQFYGKWWTFPADHFLYYSGWEASVANLEEFPVSKVTIKAWRGSDVRTVDWRFRNNRFDGKRYFEHAIFNDWNPDKVTMVFEFPYSDFKSQHTCQGRRIFSRCKMTMVSP